MQGVRSQKPLSMNEALNKIRLTSNHLKTIGTLNGLPSRQYGDALDILRRRQNSKKRNYYKLFLQGLFNNAGDKGPTIVMLCAVALGQARIANMNKTSRSTLSLQLNNHIQEFDDPVLKSLAHTEMFACPTNGTWNS